jgi:hypothetical protein
VLGQLAADRGMSLVCVQPVLTSGARKSEDLTTDKTDDKDAVLIAWLTAQLRCYLPEPVDETWGRLRHLGVRREQLLDEHVACVQQIRDLLECVWPAAATTAQQPFKSHTWLAAMQVLMTRDGGDVSRTRRLGPVRFEHAVRKELARRGRIRPCPTLAPMSEELSAAHTSGTERRTRARPRRIQTARTELERRRRPRRPINLLRHGAHPPGLEQECIKPGALYVATGARSFRRGRWPLPKRSVLGRPGCAS